MSSYDFAARPASLLARRAGKPDQPLVTSASYRPFGPLATLGLGNGLTETRGFDQRYFPQSITLSGGSNLLQWSYITDDVGNILSITDSLNAVASGKADCPRFHQGPGKPRGPRDYGQTLFHEIGHRCGVPANEPSWWQDLQRVCTGWPL